MWNAGSYAGADGIQIISPAGFEHFFWGVTELASEGAVPTRMPSAALAAEHGLVFGNAPWLEDVVARYGLTPPPAPGPIGQGS